MKKYVLLALVLGLSFLLFSCSKKISSQKSGHITILYSGNVGGEIDTCGCRIPRGGMAKRATFIKQQKEKYPNALILDSGALLFDKIKLTKNFQANSLRKAALTLDIVKKIGIDAANVSARDLANTADSLVALKERGLPWLSANIAWKSSGKLIFAPDMIKTVDNFQVGIFGFMDQTTSGIPFFDESSPIKVLDPKEAVRKEIEKLRKNSDVVIALAYMNMDRVQQLLKEIPEGPDLVIVSHTGEHLGETEHAFYIPLKTGKTLLARCPDAGGVMGVLELNVQNGLTDFMDAYKVRDLRPEEVKKTEKNTTIVSTWVNNFYDLDYQIPRDKAIQARVDSVMKLNEDFIKKITPDK
ncbi:MAG: hypothetical protein WCU00_09160 [Candidatus Latescibacterota bacterium]